MKIGIAQRVEERGTALIASRTTGPGADRFDANGWRAILQCRVEQLETLVNGERRSRAGDRQRRQPPDFELLVQTAQLSE